MNAVSGCEFHRAPVPEFAESCGRVARRLHRVLSWLLGMATGVALVLVLPTDAGAQVYKCKAADGSSRYQGTPCDGEAGARQHEVKVTAPSTPATPPARELPEQTRALIGFDRPAQQSVPSGAFSKESPELGQIEESLPVDAPDAPTTTRCTDRHGKVTYAHDGNCPLGERHRIHNDFGNPNRAVRMRPNVDSRGRAYDDRYAYEEVKEESVDLSQACRDIREGRAKSTVTTYEKNTGRDPCG